MSGGVSLRTSAGEDFLRQAVGAGEPHQALDAAQRGLLRGALFDRHAVPGDAGEDFVERAVVVDVPPEGGDIFSRAALQQKSAFVVV